MRGVTPRVHAGVMFMRGGSGVAGSLESQVGPMIRSPWEVRAGRDEARQAIKAAGRSVKLAIVMVSRSVSAAGGERLLTRAGGVVRAVVGDPPSVVE